MNHVSPLLDQICCFHLLLLLSIVKDVDIEEILQSPHDTNGLVSFPLNSVVEYVSATVSSLKLLFLDQAEK